LIRLGISNDNLNTIKTFFSRIFSFGISLIFKILLARLITVEENGVFGMWLATYNYGIIAFSLGLNVSMIYYSKSNRISIMNNFFLNIFIYIILLIICLIVFLIYSNNIYYISICFAIFFGLIISSLNSVQLANNNISIFNITEVVKNILILVLCLSPFYFLQIIPINMLYIFYTISLILTTFIFGLKLNLSEFDFKTIEIPSFSYIKYGLKGTVLNVLGQSLYIIDVFIVGSLLDPRFLGLYVVSSSVARLLWFFVDAAGTVIFPKLVKNFEIEESKKLIYKLSTFSFIISLFGIIIFYLFGEYFILITFGKEYLDGFLTIFILMVASPGMIFYKLINRYLASENDWIKSYFSIGSALILNIVLNYILINQYDIVGAAIASLISYWACGIIIAKMSRFNFTKLMFYRDFLK
jgi:O-antigen/teichoic acid export membrane protein